MRMTNRFAWLIMPLPFSIGMTEVEAVLKDMARPLALSGTDWDAGRLLR